MQVRVRRPVGGHLLFPAGFHGRTGTGLRPDGYFSVTGVVGMTNRTAAGSWLPLTVTCMIAGSGVTGGGPGFAAAV
jgi:hypothetical protein